MIRHTTKPRAAIAMGANRANDKRDEERLTLLEALRESALRIGELTDLVTDLQGRIEQLEGGK